MHGITDRQREIAQIIANYTGEHGYPPTVRDIAAEAGVTVKAAYDHLKALQKKNVIKLDEQRSRAIEIIDPQFRVPSKQISDVPMLGRISCGEGLMSAPVTDYTFHFAKDELPDGEIFAMTATGDSMIEAGINDGDIVFIKRCSDARDGEIVVAGVGEERAVTLKRFFRRKDIIELRPENHSMGPIITNDCEIYGKLIMLIRKYR